MGALGRARALRALLLLCLCDPSRGAFSGDALAFAPARARERLGITISFTSDGAIAAGETVTIGAPFLTAGPANNTRGASRDLVIDADAGARVAARFDEGQVADLFRGSTITVTVLAGRRIEAGAPFAVVIDTVNDIVLNCAPTAAAAFTIATDATSGPVPARPIAQVTGGIAGGCYVTEDRVSFSHATPKAATGVALSFRPAMPLASGDTIELRLPGFTSGDARGAAGPDVASLAVAAAPPAAAVACAYTEGAYVPGERGFDGSKVVCTMGASHAAGELLTIAVAASNALRAHCGAPGSSAGGAGDPDHPVRMSIAAAAGTVAEAAVAEVQAIGTGCRELGFCSGHGHCDHCRGVCRCQEGFGSRASDGAHIAGDPAAWASLPLDCSGRVCPGGAAHAAVPAPADAARPIRECSGSGVCDRRNGRCRCFDGFLGSACERRQCPGSARGGLACAGHGVCTPTAVLARAAGAWDDGGGSVCVCDSSWAVGLGSGETQEAEWHGADCSLRRCPSGDDPDTAADETDCAGRVAPGGAGAGAPGNLCHVSCSNRGTCDARTGVCRCYEGYYGHNCALRDVLSRGDGDGDA